LYLALGVSDSHVPTSGLRRGNLEFLPNSTHYTPTGLSPSTVGLFRPPRLLWVRGGRVLTLHLLLLSLRIRFGLFPLRSPLLREYLLVSLPSLTWMFPFREFPFLTERWRLLTSSRMSHLGTSGSKAACTYPENIAACRALLQLSSLAIHQLASACSDRLLLNLVWCRKHWNQCTAVIARHLRRHPAPPFAGRVSSPAASANFMVLDSVSLSCMVGVSGSILGGDPAAGSPAATLLRLLPPCQT
jgi:hypothetical protein